MRESNRYSFNKYIVSKSSAKPFSERSNLFRPCRKIDTSHRVVYQIDLDGNITKIWKSISEICKTFETHDSRVRYAIKTQKVISGCLFVFMIDYKTTVDYKVLMKILTKKLVKL